MPDQSINMFKKMKRALLTLFMAVLIALAGSCSSSTETITEIIPNVPENEPFFSIVVLPDTQYYSESYPHIFLEQTQWIAGNKESLNIVFVSHSGDLVNDWDDTEEWQFADIAMSMLDDVVPYGVLPGNHDQPTSLYNEYFGYERYESEVWYGGHYGENNDNNFQLFSALGIDFIIIHLQYNPTSAIVDWADGLLSTYSGRTAIINTHSALDTDSTLTDDGQALCDLMQNNPNLMLVLCGHKHGEAATLLSFTEHETHVLLANYQKLEKGGKGYLRILTFMPGKDRIAVNTYSPWLDKYRSIDTSQFVLKCTI